MRRIRKLTFALLALALASGALAVAVEAREATPEERAEFANLTRLDARCAHGRVADADGDWAVLRTTGAAGAGCQDSEFNVLHRVSGRWLSWLRLPRVHCPVTGVPAAVSGEFGMCLGRAAHRRVAFPNTAPRGRRMLRKPRRFGVGAKGGVQRIKWRRWDRSRAFGRGVYTIAGFVGRPNSGWKGPVRLVLSRVRTCRGGNRIYTRLKIIPSRRAQRGDRIPFRHGQRWTDCRSLEWDATFGIADCGPRFDSAPRYRDLWTVGVDCFTAERVAQLCFERASCSARGGSATVQDAVDRKPWRCTNAVTPRDAAPGDYQRFECLDSRGNAARWISPA